MKIIFFMITILFANIAIANECNEEIAFKNAMNAIKEKFPTESSNKELYEFNKINGDWSVYQKQGNPSQRGGGTPEVSIDQITCEVISVHLSR